ncbi:MAG: hydantoinase/oxoprolinase family protein [Dehalococcoidia bacterium]|nr:hydantoinase/oxoprolinase family protein [Dehalococcoidia bacterium]
MTKPHICYIDVGGTFTDCLIVDEKGDFVLQKASSTPQNISVGFFNSLERTVKELNMPLDDVLKQLEVLGFGATMVVNALLTRTGRKCGLIISKGFEDIYEIGRGKAGWCYFTNMADRMHMQIHQKLEPLIPRHLVRGVSERIDRLGNVLVAVREDEVRQAARELLEQGVEAIVVLTMGDYLNNENERKIARITREVVGSKVEVFESAEVCPIIREWPRACTVAIQAYTASKLEGAVRDITTRLREKGFKKDVLMMQSTGGVVTAEKTIAVNTVQSGPVGGLIGGRFIGKHYGYKNVITSDVGGTSFDVGLVINGEFAVDREPVVLNMVLAVPIAQVVSIGAGGGSIAGVDPLTGDFYVGPKSAGAVPGPVAYGRGGELPTVTDADLVLGYIDPNYFLGGDVKLDKEKAAEAIKKYVAQPLGMSVYEAASGIKSIIDARMRELLHGQLVGKGLDSRDFALLAFGGGGPTHVAGYCEGLAFKDVLIFPYSAVFSAFGASSADVERTRTRTVSLRIPATATGEQKMTMGAALNKAWQELEEWTLDQLESDGVSRESARIRRTAAVRYDRQLHDIIVESPVERIDKPEDLDLLIDAFERDYERVYTMSAKFTRAGYEIYDVSVTSSYSKVKPVLRKHALASKQPIRDSVKGQREAYFGGKAMQVNIYDMGKLKPANVIPGPCIIEAPTTTLVVPEGARIEVDEYLTMRLKRE